MLNNWQVMEACLSRQFLPRLHLPTSSYEQREGYTLDTVSGREADICDEEEDLRDDEELEEGKLEVFGAISLIYFLI